MLPKKVKLCTFIIILLQLISGERDKKLNKGVDCWLNKSRNKLPQNPAGNIAREKVLDPKPPPLSLGI